MLPALGSEHGGLGRVGDAFLVAHCRDLVSGGTAGREEVLGVDEGEGVFFSVQTSNFNTDKSDRWKPI